MGLGRAPTPEEIAAWDIDVDPTGAGLPPGRGGVDQGRELFKVRCAACHGLAGEGGLGPKLIGREPATGFAEDPKIERTIGNWWPYATTVFDYVRRAMPQTQPGSLTDDEVYALVAFLLHENGAAPDGFVADAESVRAVKMPTRVTFFPDDRPGAGVPELRR
ncbi:MAG TPA: cytochrome c [Myxococcota bacterium]|nr:cytochrome c [Myxococcota bacterium]